jgi:hypothetical protein
MIGGGDMRVDMENIAAITKCPIPMNVIEIRSFMGSTQYLRNFIAIFSKITTPLHVVTSKENRFHWGKKQDISFEYLKKRISDSPVLAMLNLQRLFELETDASGYALVSILI